MKNAAQASQEYLRTAVMTAGPEQLQLMLIDGAIRFSMKARDAVERGQIEAKFNALERAQRIVFELTNGLRREVNPALVDQFTALYDFIYRRLVHANIHHDIQAIDDALRILQHQRETWLLLIDKIRREPGAGNPAPAAPPPKLAQVAAGAPSASPLSTLQLEG